MNHDIGTDTELTGHPVMCGCLECQAWRAFLPMFREYRHARDRRLWSVFIQGFVLDVPEQRARFWAEVPASRHHRRHIESQARKLRNRRSRAGDASGQARPRAGRSGALRAAQSRFHR